jgi:uncharacterized Fe-S radical SAM superfamily protein PflX
MTLEFKKNQRLSQEIIGATLDEVRMTQETEQLASESELIVKEEMNEFIRLMEESGQESEELKAELASVAQEVDNLRDTLEMTDRELENLCVENSRAGVNRISDGYGRCATHLRSNGNLTVVGVLQSMKGSPKTSTTCNPAL